MTTTSPPRHPGRTVLTFRTPEDVLAAVPVLLGFEPSDSVVMLTFGGRETFHARVDLPPPRRSTRRSTCCSSPPCAHGVAQVLFVVYSDARATAPASLRRLAEAFAEAGIRVVDLAARRRTAVVPGHAAGCPVRRRRPPVPGAGGPRRAGRDRLPRRARGPAAPAAGSAPGGGGHRLGAAPTTRPRWRHASGVPWRRAGSTTPTWPGCCQGIRDLAVRDAAWASMSRRRRGRARDALDRRGAALARPARRRPGRGPRARRLARRPRRAGLVRGRPVRRGRPRQLARPAGRRAPDREPCRPPRGTVLVGRSAKQG